MYLAYVDESGNVGRRGTRTFTLGCSLAAATDWPQAFDGLINFRRFLRARFSVPVRAEIKANYLLRNEGPFAALALPEGMRHTIYRQTMRLHAKIGLRTFAVVIDKPRLEARDPEANPREVAWEYLLQRLRNQTERPPLAPTQILLVHDEGEEAFIRRMSRKARRAGTAGSRFGTGGLRIPFPKLLDDPVSRSSAQSYFLQLADLAAYAAFRRLYPPPSDRLVHIVPQHMWDELGEARHRPVTGSNDYAIVHWPPEERPAVASGP